MSDENEKQDLYLLFSVSSNLYAVGLPYVFRITAIDQIHPMPQNYHLCLNGSALGEKSCVSIIYSLFQESRNEDV